MKSFIALSLLSLMSCMSAPAHVPSGKEIQSVLKLEGLYRGSSGTGFVVRGASGTKYVATNEHVCGMDKHIIASTGKALYQVSPIVASKEWDLCIMSIEENDLIPFSVGFVHRGPLTFIGYPGGNGPKVQQALLLAFMPDGGGRCLGVNECGLFFGKAIGGSSGSPMLDTTGRVSCILFGGNTSNNTGICTPANVLAAILLSL